MSEDLFRVESAVRATSSGNLTWERWTHDCAVALGFAGQRNPLGFAVVRYLSDDPSSSAVWNVVLVLAGVLVKRGFAATLTKDAAMVAFDFWRDSRCPHCAGRGVTGQDQQMCGVCGGTGKREKPDNPEILRAALSELIAAEQWMEGQLRARLRDQQYQADGEGLKVNLPRRHHQDDQGFSRLTATPTRKMHE